MKHSLWARARRSELVADVVGIVAIAAIMIGFLLGAVALGASPAHASPNGKPGKFEPYSAVVPWTLPASWDYDIYPVVSSAIFPQSIGETYECGRWVQTDVYWIDSEADEQLLNDLVDGGVLAWVNGKPADSSIYSSHTFTKTAECPPPFEPERQERAVGEPLTPSCESPEVSWEVYTEERFSVEEGGWTDWTEVDGTRETRTDALTEDELAACKEEPTEPPTTPIPEPTEPPTTDEPTPTPTDTPTGTPTPTPTDTPTTSKPTPDIGTPTSETRTPQTAPPVTTQRVPGDELAETGAREEAIRGGIAIAATLILLGGVLTLVRRREAGRR